VSDYETTQRRRNVIVGIFVVAALVALGVMIYKFGDLPTAVSTLGSFQVKVQFPTATGIQKDTPVRFCGYQIGRVTSVKPPKPTQDKNTGKWYHQTLVVLSINKDHNDIPCDVDAKLMTRGLGSSYIELKLTSYDANEPSGPVLSHNSLLQGSTGMTSEFFPEESQKKLEELVDGIKTFVDNANDIFGDPANKENIKTTLAHLSEATNQATKTLEEFQRLSAAGATTLRNADAKVDELVAAVVDTSEQLGKATVEMRLVLEKINTGQGTAARLLNDGRLYENLLENTEQIQLLAEELTAFVTQVRQKGLPLKLK
jgi:phospholipid/cholesterol/gamma-HCH transport system substrate-binding protein